MYQRLSDVNVSVVEDIIFIDTIKIESQIIFSNIYNTIIMDNAADGTFI